MLPQLARDANCEAIQCLRLGAPQIVSFDGSVASTALAVGVVRLCSTEDCYIVAGTAPTATTGGTFLPANCPEYFRVEAGLKIAAIKSETAGVLSITQMA